MLVKIKNVVVEDTLIVAVIAVAGGPSHQSSIILKFADGSNIHEVYTSATVDEVAKALEAEDPFADYEEDGEE